MKTVKLIATALLLSITAISSANVEIKDLEIPHSKHVLDNGLTVLIHEDHKAPIVAVSIWYHVGSKDEKPGKTGFAHLFEHLMFNGSENYDDEYFKPFDEVGATSMNGTTWHDRTNYFQNVPSTALDMALWMESDRMGHLLGVVTQEKLDNQRGVVQNEKRQGDNRPYGRSEYSILEGLFPEGHPYRWSTIGSLEDLNAASLDDVKEWFKQYYGAANTVLVLAGDVDTDDALAKVKKYFGDIPAGPPLYRKMTDVPVKSSITKEIMYDNVPQRRIYRDWAVPGRTSEEIENLDLALRILGDGKTSRLYQRLIIEESLATDIEAFILPFELASVFNIEVTLNAEADANRVNEIITEEIDKFIQDGPSKEEVETVKTKHFASSIRGMERIGGFSGKANTLAKAELYAGDSNYYLTQLKRYQAASADSIKTISQQWLSKPYHQLTILPFPKYTVYESDVDRSEGVPKVNQMPELEFPKVAQTQLKNGVPVYIVNRPSIPELKIAFLFDGGFASDSQGHALGTSSFMMEMLKEGTQELDGTAMQIALDKLGAQLEASSTLDNSVVQINALKSNLKPSLQLATSVLKAPALRETDIKKVKGLRLAAIEQENANPVRQALRVLPPLIYGNDHPYGIPLTGSGTPESVTTMTAEKLRDYQNKWLRPDNLKIVAVGDVEQQQLLAILEEQLDDWQVSGNKGTVELKAVANNTKPVFYLVDKPAAPQSLILAGKVTPSSSDGNHLTFDTSNLVIGGKFTARINMNLREDKGWAYGAYTFYRDAKGQKPWMIYAPVQTDKTTESVLEIIKEINAYRSDNPATEEELALTVQSEIRSLPGLYETNDSVIDSLIESLTFDRPVDYPTQLQTMYRDVAVEDLREVAKQEMVLDEMIWVIVGDVEKIKAGIESIGEVKLLDL
ncbi:MAG: M16 family metallopeptidase [Aestuariibacter sp.]